MKTFLVIFGIFLLCLLTVFTKPTFAANDCTIIYGGGEIACTTTTSNDTKKLTVTPAQSGQAQTSTNSETTKGGLQVYAPTKAAETPATGPEALALITLIPTAAAGWYLRKK